MLVNLIANATEVRGSGQGWIGYVTVGRAPGSPASIVIEDNGIGIAPGKLAAIFEQFVRAHTDRDEELGAQGLGLGLAIVQESMEAMGGTVTVSLKEGAGTAFTFDLAKAAIPSWTRHRGRAAIGWTVQSAVGLTASPVGWTYWRWRMAACMPDAPLHHRPQDLTKIFTFYASARTRVADAGYSGAIESRVWP